MYYYAQIDLATRVCFAITQTHSPVEAVDMIEIDGLHSDLRGKRHDEATGEFEAVPPAPVRVLTHLQYMNRFTDDELEAIYTAAKTVVKVEVWLAKFNAAGDVDLDDPQTGKGLLDLEAARLLATGRAAQILA